MQRADNFVPRLSTWRVALTMAIAVTGVVCGSRAQTLRPGDRAPLQTSTHMTQVPARPFDVVLARPTDRSVTLSLRSTQSRNIAVFYGHAGGTAVPGPTIALAAGVPGEAVLGDLVPDAEYSFELRAADGMAEPYTGRFHTQRLRGQSFTFTITADSHLDAGTRAELYARTLTNIAADRPDFHVDLGDTFMTEKYESGFKEALPQYLAQRYWFGLLRAPLFLALGNHDGESGIARRPQDAEMSLWSAQMRTALFPNPEPGVFFSGNARPLPGVEIGRAHV